MDATTLKAKVKGFWEDRPCGSAFSQEALGAQGFFQEVTGHRHRSHTYLREWSEFSHHMGERLLEIGCGLGTDGEQFARGRAKVVGLDLTETAVKLTGRRFAMQGVAYWGSWLEMPRRSRFVMRPLMWCTPSACCIISRTSSARCMKSIVC